MTETLVTVTVPDLMKLSDAAEKFGISERMIRDLMAEGRIHRHRLGRLVLVDPAELYALACTSAGRPDPREQVAS